MKFPHLLVLSLLVGTFHQASAATTPNGYVVRMDTALGNIDIWLRPEAAPITVGNFLNYVLAGYYQDTFFHRSAPVPHVIQGGGFHWFDTTPHFMGLAPTFTSPNEYNLSNIAGTVAMARTSNTTSATNQWYFNVSDNSSMLDPQLFTVFGTVINSGMDVVDAIAALPVEDQSAENPAFNTLPLINHTIGNPLAGANMVLVRDISILSSNAPVRDASGKYTSLSIVVPPGSTPPPSADTFKLAANPSPPDAPSGVTFGQGFFKINISGFTPGGTIRTILRLPPGAHPNTYYKWGPTPDNPVAHWYNFMWDGTTGAIFENTDPTQVALIFVDGARGDDDLTADGKISDVGGPGIGPATGSSGGGGALDWLSLGAGLLIWLRRGSMRRFR